MLQGQGGSALRKKTRAPGTGGTHVGFNKTSRATRVGGASTNRTFMSTSTRRTGTSMAGAATEKVPTPIKHQIQVFDESGHDVTPLPLLQSDMRRLASNVVAAESSAGTPTELQQQSIYQTGTVAASVFGGGPFTRSVFSTSQSGRSTSGSITDELIDTGEEIMGLWPQTKLQYKQVEETEVITETELEVPITINLTETPTIWLFELVAVCMSSENEEAEAIKKNNEVYKELVRSRAGNDRYAERGMNTLNEQPKTKVVQTNRVVMSDAGVMATNWDMYDTYALLNEKVKDHIHETESTNQSERTDEPHGTDKSSVTAISPDKLSAASKMGSGMAKVFHGVKHRKGPRSTMISMAQLTESIATTTISHVDSLGESSVSHPVPVAVSTSETSSIAQAHILESEELRRDLVIMERVVNMNTYQPRQAAYRDLPALIDVDKESEAGSEKTPSIPALTELGPSLNRLWAYQCPMTKGHNVSYITWNKHNPDIVAIGYGEFEFSKQKGGLVCCWSLKNPEYPERVYTCVSGVMSLDFSSAHPNLLAVGLYDGTVAIYNVRNPNNDTILDSLESSGKHTNPVWQLKWIERDHGSADDTTEVLVSISTDGRITQWSIRKGFESYDLMRLKRIGPKSTSTHKTKKPEAFISQYAGGMCFDFSPKDANIYLAGTEDGHIHKCSCSYNEQYLDNFYAHTGPVYKIQWSPFCPDVFLSCSADWSIRLWHQDHLQPIFTFHSSAKCVPDVCWSPFSATVFTCANEGAVEVWDLSLSTLDPVIVNTPAKGTKLSTVSFSNTTQCILVGDNEGVVSVYQLTGLEPPGTDHVHQLQNIIQTSLASQLGVK